MGHNQQAGQRRSRRPAFKQTTLSFVIAAAIYSAPLHAQHVELNLPSQPLQQSIQQLARQSGAEIISAGSILSNITAPRIKGKVSVEQALNAMLQGTNLTVQKQGSVYAIVEKKAASSPAVQLQQKQPAQLEGFVSSPADQPAVQMNAITVYGAKDRDTQGYDDVYEKNYSTVYAGKDLIERFKGSSPADLFKGMSNVYSGDARNSGAVDPNIRGIQGPGRIALTVDGTEQSLAAWRGYNGVSNRNYIDPNLIGGMQVIKGPNQVRDVKSGIGGAVVVNTLSASDIVKAGESWGGEIKLEGSNNTIKERLSPSYDGRDYRDVVEELGLPGWTSQQRQDPILYKPLRSSSSNDFLNLEDQAARIALATKQDNFELLGAYAWRERGNYFSGKKGSAFYDKEGDPGFYDFVPMMARIYKPGDEVPNTSSRMESWLLKGKWNISDEQEISAGYRDSQHTYGEIMPSRISWSDTTQAGETVVPQWPLSTIDIKAYNLDYKYTPAENRWVDLHTSFWMTDADSDLYNSGGFPNAVGRFDWRFKPNAGRTPVPPGQPNPYLIKDTAHMITKNTRKGFNISNKMNLTKELDLTLSGSFQTEKLRSIDPYPEVGEAGFRMAPRSGQRKEHEYSFNFDWMPADWLSVSAGARTVSYSLTDDLLKSRMQEKPQYTVKWLAKELTHTLRTDNLTQEQIDSWVQHETAFRIQKEQLLYGHEMDLQAITDSVNTAMEFEKIGLQYQLGQAHDNLRMNSLWMADSSGDFHLENNPYLNGTIDLSKVDNLQENKVQTEDLIQRVERNNYKKKDHGGWVPFISAAVKFSPESRLYLNYSEALRMPSMFEGTLGFSGGFYADNPKPEHAHAYEAAYVHDLSRYLDASHADIKLAYFYTLTNDVIERDNNFRFANIDKQTLAGWELQGRYDSGKFFTDLSLVYNQKNEVCDDISATKAVGESIYKNPELYKKCVDHGFVNGYLLTMAQPKYSANLNLGTRLLDQKLELGSRLTWHSKHSNQIDQVVDSGFFNAPLSWDNLLLVDAYMNYKPRPDLSFDLVGTNLTNRYYIDPLSRTSYPAPGRTLKLGLTYSF